MHKSAKSTHNSLPKTMPISAKFAVVIVDMLESRRSILTYNVDGEERSDKRSVDLGISRVASVILEARKMGIPIFFASTLEENSEFISELSQSATGANCIVVAKQLTSSFDLSTLPSFELMARKYGYIEDAESIARDVEKLHGKLKYPRLGEYLSKENPIPLVICGFNRTCCVFATAKDAIHLGHKVLVSNQLMFGHTGYSDDWTNYTMDFYRTRTYYKETSEGLIEVMRKLVQVS